MAKKEKFLLIFILCLSLFVLLKPGFLNKPDEELVLAISPFTLTIDNETGEQIYLTGKAKLLIAHPNENWRIEEIFNPDAIVAHKAAIGDVDNDGKKEMVVTFGCKSLYKVKEEKCPLNASVKVYKFKNNEWESELVWSLGESSRARDVEIGDVDNDGKNEIVFGTHKPGLILVLDYISGNYIITEVDRDDTSIVHEIEIADVDNDGIDEFFATITLPNVEGKIHPGLIKMYKWNGYNYDVMIVENNTITNAKEIVLGDIDNDGKKELIAVYSCVPKSVSDPSLGLALPIQVKKFNFDGEINQEVIYNISGRNPSDCFITDRSANIGDVNNDEINDYVLGTHTLGIHIISLTSGILKTTIIDNDTEAGIHTLIIGDFDQDERNEIISASDGDNTVKMHKWNGKWTSEVVFNTTKEDLTWAMDYGDIDNDWSDKFPSINEVPNWVLLTFIIISTFLIIVYFLFRR